MLPEVPGHERLVHTMIAGASGIDLALLVVAADEGIMPQTLEHLEVIRLMGVPGGAVALTKIDLVEPDLIELAMEEVRELLAGTPFEHVPMVPVSASAGDGIDDAWATEVLDLVYGGSRRVIGPYGAGTGSGFLDVLATIALDDGGGAQAGDQGEGLGRRVLAAYRAAVAVSPVPGDRRRRRHHHRH